MDVVTHHKRGKNDGPLLKVGSHAPIGASLREVAGTIPNQESNVDLRFNIDVQALYHRGNKVPGNNLKSRNRWDYAQSVQNNTALCGVCGSSPRTQTG